jgi:hypothetical protein
MVIIFAAILIPPLVIYVVYKLVRFFFKLGETVREDKKETRDWQQYQASHPEAQAEKSKD